MQLKLETEDGATIDLRHIMVSAAIAAVAALIVTTLVAFGVGRGHPLTWVSSAATLVCGTVWLAQQDIRRLWEGAWQ